MSVGVVEDLTNIDYTQPVEYMFDKLEKKAFQPTVAIDTPAADNGAFQIDWEQEYFTISGWATCGEASCGALYLKVNGTWYLAEKASRPDISAAWGERFLYCGFRFKIPIAAFWGSSQFEIVAVSDDFTYSMQEIRYDITTDFTKPVTFPYAELDTEDRQPVISIDTPPLEEGKFPAESAAEYLMISGWIKDEVTDTSYGEVYLKVGEEYFKGRSTTRQELAAGWGEQYLYAGYEFSIPVSALRNADEIAYVVVSADYSFLYAPVIYPVSHP
jgi:hypothetical protein